MVWTDIFIKRPVLSVVVSLLILLIGFRAATTLPIRQYPKLSNTVVNITTVYPGASRRPDPGLHHHADRAGGRLRRRRRLHDLVLGARHLHDPGLHQAELRSEPGADRSARQGELGQIPDSEGIQRPDRDQDDRPDHGRDVSRLLQRSAVGLGDLGLSDPRGSAGACPPSTASPRPTFWAARPLRCGCGSIPCAWPAAACRRRMFPPRSPPTTSRRPPASPRATSSSPTSRPTPT